MPSLCSYESVRSGGKIPAYGWIAAPSDMTERRDEWPAMTFESSTARPERTAETLDRLGISPELMERARTTIRRYLPPTPLLESPLLSARAGRPVLLKVEGVTATRSFKLRGALVRVTELEAAGDTRPLLTASAGNHGLGVAYAGRLLGRPVTVYVPENANEAKVAALRQEGATVVASGKDYADAAAAADLRAARGLDAYVHPFDDPAVIAGQATVATEILDARPDVGAVVVPVGGGGLLGGIAAGLRRAGSPARIYGVEAQGADVMLRSWNEDALVTLEAVHTIADGLAPRRVSERTLALAKALTNGILLVPDDALLEAMHHLLVRERLLAEPSGSAAVAAFLRGLLPTDTSDLTDTPGNGPLVLVVTGANVTDALLRSALAAPLPDI